MVVALLVATTAGCRTAEKQGDARMEERSNGSSSGSVASSAADSGPTRRVYDSLIAAGTARATFAAGCFWCVESAFDDVPGVIATVSGYTGGSTPDPSYDDVSSGGTGHAEAVMVFYDSTRATYAQLLDVYWRNVDPLTRDRQFCDAGTQYRSAIFVHDDAQRRLADSSRRALDASRRFDQPIVTEVSAVTAFTPAEEYHQDFYLKQPERYEEYRLGCRRDQRLREIWGEEAKR